MRLLFCVLALATVLGSSHAFAGSRTFNGTASVPQTLVTNIVSPGNTQSTTFTGYTAGPYNYSLYTFSVDQSGVYTATSTTTNVLNTTWVLNGLFSPSSTAPATPLSAFIISVLALNTTPKVGTFNGFNLTAGNTYTVLVAYNTGATPGVDASTFTITGPGNIADCGGATCAAAVPTTSEWTLILMGLLLAASAGVVIQRRYRTAI